MINDIYNFTISVLAAVLFVFGLLFRCLDACRDRESHNYRMASIMMIFAYCFFGFVNLMELLSKYLSPENDDVLLFQTAALIVSVSQAFMMTYSMILLIDVSLVTRRTILNEAIPILIVSVTVSAAYFLMPDASVKIFVYLFMLFYVYLLIKYTRLFMKAYRECLHKLNNFFSCREPERLRWVNFSFFTALGLGITTFIAGILPSMLVGIVISILCLLFYGFFAIRFFNYGYVFKENMKALSVDNRMEEKKLSSVVISAIETNLKEWIEKKQYLTPGVTIEEASAQIGTNIKYLSVYINKYKGKTFREWINDLKIGEAKDLLLKYPEMTVNEIALRTGFANQSNFGRQFLKHTEKSPGAWRRKAE